MTARGDGREAIYFGDADREAWLDVLGRVCERFNWRCHAWCQMTNHYHLLVETPEANLSRGMRQLNGVYTQYINRTHARVGHVFQGRYTAERVRSCNNARSQRGSAGGGRSCNMHNCCSLRSWQDLFESNWLAGSTT